MKTYLFYFVGKGGDFSLPFLCRGFNPKSAQLSLDRMFGRGKTCVARLATIKEKIRYHKYNVGYESSASKRPSYLGRYVEFCLRAGFVADHFGTYRGDNAKINMIVRRLDPKFSARERRHEEWVEMVEHYASEVCL